MKEIQYQSSCSERFMAGQLGRETAVRVPMLRCWWKKGVATYSLGIAIVNHRKPTYCRCWSWSPPVSKKSFLTVSPLNVSCDDLYQTCITLLNSDEHTFHGTDSATVAQRQPPMAPTWCVEGTRMEGVAGIARWLLDVPVQVPCTSAHGKNTSLGLSCDVALS